eukprot:g59190.t1
MHLNVTHDSSKSTISKETQVTISIEVRVRLRSSGTTIYHPRPWCGSTPKTKSGQLFSSVICGERLFPEITTKSSGPLPLCAYLFSSCLPRFLLSRKKPNVLPVLPKRNSMAHEIDLHGRRIIPSSPKRKRARPNPHPHAEAVPLSPTSFRNDNISPFLIECKRKTLESLASELIEFIATYLHPAALTSLLCTNRHFRLLCSGDPVWMALISLTCPSLLALHSSLLAQPTPSLKALYSHHTQARKTARNATFVPPSPPGINAYTFLVTSYSLDESRNLLFSWSGKASSFCVADQRNFSIRLTFEMTSSDAAACVVGEEVRTEVIAVDRYSGKQALLFRGWANGMGENQIPDGMHDIMPEPDPTDEHCNHFDFPVPLPFPRLSCYGNIITSCALQSTDSIHSFHEPSSRISFPSSHISFCITARCESDTEGPLYLQPDDFLRILQALPWQ